MTRKEQAEKVVVLLKKMSSADSVLALGIMEGMIIARNPAEIENISVQKDKPAA